MFTQEEMQLPVDQTDWQGEIQGPNPLELNSKVEAHHFLIATSVPLQNTAVFVEEDPRELHYYQKTQEKPQEINTMDANKPQCLGKNIYWFDEKKLYSSDKLDQLNVYWSFLSSV